MSVDLRLGSWQDVLSDVESVDAIICDPPYGWRTHSGQRHGRRGDGGHHAEEWASSRGIGYAHLTPRDVRLFVESWAPRCRGWFCAMTSHDLVPHWEKALRRAGFYVFKPVPIVLKGMNVRLAGDGPSSWSVEMVHAASSLVPARPIGLKTGTLPGAYVGLPFEPGQNTAKASRRQSVVGSKPLWLMQEIVRDYTAPGDLVCDPCSGGGTTARACMIEGRRFVGAELDPKTYALAMERIRGLGPSTEQQPSLFGGVR